MPELVFILDRSGVYFVELLIISRPMLNCSKSMCTLQSRQTSTRLIMISVHIVVREIFCRKLRQIPKII